MFYVKDRPFDGDFKRKTLLFLLFMMNSFDHNRGQYQFLNTNIVCSEHCAPNLLITFINMMLFKEADVDTKLIKCHGGKDIFFVPFIINSVCLSGGLTVPLLCRTELRGVYVRGPGRLPEVSGGGRCSHGAHHAHGQTALHPLQVRHRSVCVRNSCTSCIRSVGCGTRISLEILSRLFICK